MKNKILVSVMAFLIFPCLTFAGGIGSKATKDLKKSTKKEAVTPTDPSKVEKVDPLSPRRRPSNRRSYNRRNYNKYYPKTNIRNFRYPEEPKINNIQQEKNNIQSQEDLDQKAKGLEPTLEEKTTGNVEGIGDQRLSRRSVDREKERQNAAQRKRNRLRGIQ